MTLFEIKELVIARSKIKTKHVSEFSLSIFFWFEFEFEFELDAYYYRIVDRVMTDEFQSYNVSRRPQPRFTLHDGHSLPAPRPLSGLGRAEARTPGTHATAVTRTVTRQIHACDCDGDS